MAQPGKQLLHDLEAGMAGQPRRPPTYRRTPAWVLLGAGCYPVIVGIAVVYVRRAERNERAFDDLVGPR